MTAQQALSFAVLAGTMALFVHGRLRYDLVAVLALLVSVLTGVVPADKAFDGFGDDIVIIVAGALVVSAAVARSGVTEALVAKLLPEAQSVRLQMFALVGSVTVLSAFVKNIGALAMMIPIAFRMAKQSRVSPSVFLMPMAFGSLLGGLVTQIGTSPNIIVSRVRGEMTGEPFGMFDFTPVGIGLAAAGTVFLVLFHRLVPTGRTPARGLDEAIDVKGYTTEARVPAGSPVVGLTVPDAVLAVLAIGRELPRIAPSGVLWDYGSFLASARAGLAGLDPYGIHPLTMHVSLPGFEGWNPNLNPPISVLLFRAFDLFEPATGMRIWQAVSLGLWAFAVALLLLRYAQDRSRLGIAATALWCFGLAGFWDTLFLGQIYIPVALAVVIGWLLLERGSAAAAGVLIGVAAAMKPNLLVWPGLLLLAGHRKTAVPAGLSFATLSAVPLFVFGPGIYARWVELVAGDGARAGFLTNAALSGLLARANAQAAAPALSAVLLGVGALHAYSRRPDVMRTSEIGMLLALLASPLAWVHYTLFLVPIFMRRRSAADFVPAALLLVPVPFIIGLLDASAVRRLTFGSAYNWALLFFAVLVVARPRASSEGRRSRVLEAAQ